MNVRLSWAAKACMAAALAAQLSAANADLVLNVSGAESREGLGSNQNLALTIDLFPGNVLVDRIQWDLGLTTFGGSWLSEATVLIRNSAGAGIAFQPGFGDDLAGTRNYAGTISLLALGEAFPVLSDGRLRVEFYESFNDVANGPDAVYTSGSISLIGINAVPEPASAALVLTGALLIAASRRRRA